MVSSFQNDISCVFLSKTFPKSCMILYRVFIRLFSFLIKLIQVTHKSKNELIIENLVLRQQLSCYQLKKTKPKLTNFDRSFWIALNQTCKKWKYLLLIVKPKTIIEWQNRRVKTHWTKISTKNKRPGRKRIKKKIRELIYRMAGENHWAAPRIFSELMILGLKRWLQLDHALMPTWCFLYNHTKNQ